MKPMPKPLTSSIRVLLIGSHSMLRSGLRMLIENQPGLVVIGETGIDSGALIAAHQCPDIILLDLDRESEDSLALLSELKLVAKRARVLVLTSQRNPKICLCALHLGAMGLVLKEKSAEVLIEAIRSAHAGEVWLDSSMTTILFGEILRAEELKNADPESDKIATLTGREREVIDLICEGLKNKQIGARLFISEITVRHHLTSIFNKLGVADRVGLVIYSYRRGLAKPPR
jgi:DNA-binding NarL/FixJ family response regulator